MPRPPQPPKYRHYKPKNLAVVRIAGRDHYLGLYGSPESFERYARLLAERNLPPQTVTSPALSDSSAFPVKELLLRYWQFAAGYYVKHGNTTSELACIRAALRPVRRLYGNLPATEFGPLALKAVREEMVRGGLCRSTINSNISRIRRMFAWGVEQELIPASILMALRAVSGLRAGRSGAREPRPVRAVADERVQATLPHLPPVVRAMVEFQRLTACRPGEVCLLRPCDLERFGTVWVYRPARYKTEHHEQSREILVGPQAQAILDPYLQRGPETYCFQPAVGDGKRGRASARRKPGGYRVGSHYTKDSYRRAIVRACEQAFEMPQELRRPPVTEDPAEITIGRRQAAEWRAENCWAPNQLRHAAGTEIRKVFGLEAAQVVLGHKLADVTQVYAERNRGLAQRVIETIG